jgi:hypothetical protein
MDDLIVPSCAAGLLGLVVWRLLASLLAWRARMRDRKAAQRAAETKRLRIQQIVDAVFAANAAFQEGNNEYDFNNGNMAMMEVLNAEFPFQTCMLLFDVMHLMNGHVDNPLQEHPRFNEFKNMSPDELYDYASTLVARLVDQHA